MVNLVINKETVPKGYYKSDFDLKIDCGPHSYYGCVANTELTNEIKHENNSAGYIVETVYVNRSHLDITVMDRTGLAMSVEKNNITLTHSIQRPGFVIRKLITLNGASVISALQCVNSIDNLESNELKIIRDSLKNLNLSKYSTVKMMLDYTIPVDDIIKAPENTIYHYQCDVVLTTKDSVKAIVHPFSSRFNNLGLFELINNDYKYDTGSIHLKLRYVNHEEHANPLYMKVAGEVRKLYPEKNVPYKNLDDGDIPSKYIEIFSTAKSSIYENGLTGIISKKYSLQEAREQLGIFSSVIEAQEYGVFSEEKKALQEAAKAELENIKLTNSIELENLKHKNNLLEADISALKRDNELKQKQLDVYLLELKQRQADKDNIYHNDKYQNERRNMDREETINIIKFFSVLIGTVSTVMVAIIKISK